VSEACRCHGCRLFERLRSEADARDRVSEAKARCHATEAVLRGLYRRLGTDALVYGTWAMACHAAGVHPAFQLAGVVASILLNWIGRDAGMAFYPPRNFDAEKDGGA
jgi:hypothetical protein